MDIKTFLKRQYDLGTFRNLAGNPLSQFGTPAMPLLGATLLPERNVGSRIVQNSGIRFRTVIAGHGNRHSPTVIRGETALASELLVRLGDQDTGSELTAEDYEAFQETLNAAGEIEAVARLLNWTEVTLNRPLMQLNEKMRWQAILDGQIADTGPNNVPILIDYLKPSGHRPNAGGTWSSDAYDPWADLQAGAAKLASAGFPNVSRIISRTGPKQKFLGNAKVKERLGAGTVFGANPYMRRLTQEELNRGLADDRLPAWETYDSFYFKADGTSAYYVPDTVAVMVANTGQNVNVEAGSEIILLNDTLGYHAVGPASGQSGPGRVIKVRLEEDEKPVGLRGSAWQCSLPIVEQATAIYVIKSIS